MRRFPTVPTIVFFPEGAYGPTNNCIGIGDILRRRGHRVVFVVEESFKGTLEAKGFEERLIRLQPPAEGADEDPGQFWKDFIAETAPVFRRPTIEQLEAFIAPTFQALIDGARYADDRLREVFDELVPDAIVEDNVVAFPAIAASGRPWVRIASCNPLELKDDAIPPVFSGYAAADRAGWDEFRAEYARTHGDIQASFDAFCRERGAPGLPGLELIGESPYLNLYLYPGAVDYERARPLAPTWHNLQTSVRGTDAEWQLPAALADGDGPLVYLSLGSLGAGDVGLMQRLIDVLAETPYRVIVSMGPRHDELELAGDMAGEEFLPQTSLLPHVDAVVTHGGNNTTTECLHFGLPMVVLPLFWDQYDNAQRMHETGFGVRLDTYGFEDGALAAAIDGLLADGAQHERAAALAQRLRAARGTERAADLIERVAATGAPVTRAG
jgi:MGT family glycosyltransferase